MIFKGLEVSITGMQAQRIRLDIASSNLANVNSTNDGTGKPYRRKVPVFETVLDNSQKIPLYRVKVSSIKPDMSPLKAKYEPGNPDADENGYVYYPNVDPIREMVDMMSAIRTYGANLTAFNTHKDILIKTIDILKV